MLSKVLDQKVVPFLLRFISRTLSPLYKDCISFLGFCQIFHWGRISSLGYWSFFQGFMGCSIVLLDFAESFYRNFQCLVKVFSRVLHAVFGTHLFFVALMSFFTGLVNFLDILLEVLGFLKVFLSS